MIQLLQFEKDDDNCLLKNTTLTTTRTYIGYGEEDKNKYGELSANYQHIISTDRENVEDMRAVKGTMQLSQVNGHAKINNDTTYSLTTYKLPCSCPSCRLYPYDDHLCIYKGDRESNIVRVKMLTNETEQAVDDPYGILSLKVNELKVELKQRFLRVGGNKKDLQDRLEAAIALEYDVDEDMDIDGDLNIGENEAQM